MAVAPGKIFKIVGQVGEILSVNGVLDQNGDFASPISVEGIAKAAADVEKVLAADGVSVQGNVEKAIQALPLILSLLGVK